MERTVDSQLLFGIKPDGTDARPLHQFKYKRIWDNIVTHVQISLQRQGRNDSKCHVFTGAEVVDLVLLYIKDLQFVEKSYVPATKQINRKTAFQMCKRLLEERVIESDTAIERKSGDSSPGRFCESKRYRLPRENNINSDLADLMGRCSLSSDRSGKVNKENRRSQVDVSYEVFMELFGSPLASEVSQDDEMSISSSDSSQSGSVASERGFLSFWDLNFADCMEIWREVSLERLLYMTHIELLEKLLERSKEDDAVAIMEKSAVFLQQLVLPPLVHSAVQILDDSPHFLSALAQTNVNEIHPLTLVQPVFDHCSARFAEPLDKSVLETIMLRVRGSAPKTGSLLPARHADLHAAICELLRRKGEDAAVEALQLYNLLLPWCRREYFKKLLTFLKTASGFDVPLLHREMTNKDFLVNKFHGVIFSESLVVDKSRFELLCLMIDKADLIFGIPIGVKEEVETRICVAGNIGTVELRSVFSETNKNGNITSASLISLLMTVDQNVKDPQEKQRFLKNFKQTYPETFQQYFGSFDRRC